VRAIVHKRLKAWLRPGPGKPLTLEFLSVPWNYTNAVLGLIYAKLQDIHSNRRALQARAFKKVQTCAPQGTLTPCQATISLGGSSWFQASPSSNQWRYVSIRPEKIIDLGCRFVVARKSGPRIQVNYTETREKQVRNKWFGLSSVNQIPDNVTGNGGGTIRN